MRNSCLKCVLCLALTAIVGVIPLSAATRKLVIDVPFAFTAGSAKLTPGKYAMVQSEGENVIFIVNEANGSAVALIPEAPLEWRGVVSSSVNFVKKDGAYYLNMIRTAGGPC